MSIIELALTGVVVLAVVAFVAWKKNSETADSRLG